MPDISKVIIADPRAVDSVRVSYPTNEVRTVRVSDLVSTTSGGGAGTVTSVALSTSVSGLSVSGSPITSSGTIALSGTVSAVTQAAVTAHQSAITITLSQVSDAGGAAALNVGTTAGTVCAGNDSRLSDSRTPTTHASSHVGAGSDAIREATAAQNGLMSSAYATKLDGIESGATGDMGAAEILAALLTVDGAGSGLDADTLDGNSSAAFALAGHNHDSTYQPLDTQLTSLAGLSYTGNSLKVVRVNSGETGFELATVSTGGVTSVAISGTDGIEVDSGSPITSSGTIQLGVNVAALKVHLSLDNVENTTLSTWAGSANIATVGTITSGTWAGTAIGDDYIASATAWNAKISDISGQSLETLNNVEYTIGGLFTGDLLMYDGTKWTDASLSEAGIQPLDSQLTDLAALSYAGNAGKFIRVNAGESAFELATVSGSGTVTSVAISGSDGIEIDSGSPITTTGTIALGINASALKTHLSLGNVENTALSTWAGSTNITTLGTVATGTWSGTAIAVNKGGTGATDASTARTNLGLAIGTNVQAYDAGLSSLAGLSTTDKIYYLSAADTWSAVTVGSGLSFSSGTLSASGGSGTTLSRKSSLQSITSTSLVDVTSLSFSASANTKYAFRAIIIWYSSVSTEGPSFAVNGPSSPTSVVYSVMADRSGGYVGIIGAATAYDTAFAQTVGSTSARLAIIEGVVENGANAGTVIIRAATETNSGGASITIDAGSVILYQQIT